MKNASSYIQEKIKNLHLGLKSLARETTIVLFPRARMSAESSWQEKQQILEKLHVPPGEILYHTAQKPQEPGTEARRGPSLLAFRLPGETHFFMLSHAQYLREATAITTTGWSVFLITLQALPPQRPSYSVEVLKTVQCLIHGSP